MKSNADRPLSVTLSSAFIITFGLIGILAVLTHAPRTGTTPLGSVLSAIFLGLEVLCAICIWHGSRLARTFWLTLVVAAFALSYPALSPSGRVAVGMMNAAEVYGLFNAASNCFFSLTVTRTVHSIPSQKSAKGSGLRNTFRAVILFIAWFPRLIVSTFVARLAASTSIGVIEPMLTGHLPDALKQTATFHAATGLANAILAVVIELPLVVAAVRFVTRGATIDSFVWNWQREASLVAPVMILAEILTYSTVFFGRISPGQRLVDLWLALAYFGYVGLRYYVFLRAQLLVAACATDTRFASLLTCWRATGHSFWAVALATCGWYVPWILVSWFGTNHMAGLTFHITMDIAFDVLFGCSTGLLFVKLVSEPAERSVNGTV